MEYEILLPNVTHYAADGHTYLGTFTQGEIVLIKKFRKCDHRELGILEDDTYLISQIGDKPPIIKKVPKKKKGIKKDGT